MKIPNRVETPKNARKLAKILFATRHLLLATRHATSLQGLYKYGAFNSLWILESFSGESDFYQVRGGYHDLGRGGAECSECPPSPQVLPKMPAVPGLPAYFHRP